MRERLRISLPRRKARVVAEFQQMDLANGAVFTPADDFDVGREKQPPHARLIGELMASRQGENGNAAIRCRRNTPQL